jgi:hypothetical protein
LTKSIRSFLSWVFGTSTNAFYSSGSQALSTVDLQSRRIDRTGGTYSNLYANVISNTRAGTGTVRLRDNGANGNKYTRKFYRNI